MSELAVLAKAVGRALAHLAPPDVWRHLLLVGFFATRTDGPNRVWLFGLSRNRRS